MDSANPLDARFGPNDNDTEISVCARWIGSWRILLQRVPAACECLLGRVVGEEQVAETATPLRVLECGVRTGALASAFARVSPAPFTLDAVDLSAQMLERAGRNLRGGRRELAAPGRRARAPVRRRRLRPGVDRPRAGAPG